MAVSAPNAIATASTVRMSATVCFCPNGTTISTRIALYFPASLVRHSIKRTLSSRSEQTSSSKRRAENFEGPSVQSLFLSV